VTKIPSGALKEPEKTIAEIILKNGSAIKGNRRDAVKKCFLWRRPEFASDERFVAKLVVIEVAFTFMRKAIRRLWVWRHRAGERFFATP